MAGYLQPSFAVRQVCYPWYLHASTFYQSHPFEWFPEYEEVMIYFDYVLQEKSTNSNYLTRVGEKSTESHGFLKL